MQTFILIKTQFEAIHHWPGCPHDDVAFLRDKHRHIFHVKAKAAVNHDDRDIEFIQFKRAVTDYLRNHFDRADLGATSCEMMCGELLEAFPEMVEVAVWEDAENGAQVVRDAVSDSSLIARLSELERQVATLKGELTAQASVVHDLEVWHATYGPGE